MKRLLTISALTCALSVSVMAGQIPTVGAPDPPPVTSPSSIELPSLSGDIPTDGFTGQSNDVLFALLSELGFLAV